ncbi:MAG: transcriptional repressor [Candidatus Marinimicrobia bacterium]|nr:transcriptional repressor [Candidatus Neomarinimicrobiota bacterium]|tara:strand:- start:89 stop:523 length:435 start_codon:yes stop_codon:yes gene_type:complete
MSSNKNNLTKILKISGLRNTPQRQAILDELNRTRDHRDVEEIYFSLKKKGIKVSRATVYRTLELFVNHYLIRRLDLGEGKYRYESRESDHHDHIVCLDCNKITEFMNNRIEELQEEVAQENGFFLKRHVHQLFGHCLNETCPNK